MKPLSRIPSCFASRDKRKQEHRQRSHLYLPESGEGELPLGLAAQLQAIQSQSASKQLFPPSSSSSL